jgi:hypothetical protein
MFHVEHFAACTIRLSGAPGALTGRNVRDTDGLDIQPFWILWHIRPRLCPWFSTEHRRPLRHRFLGTSVGGRKVSDLASLGLQPFRRTRTSGAPGSHDHLNTLPRRLQCRPILHYGVPILHIKHLVFAAPELAFANNDLAKLFHVEQSAYPPYPRSCLNLGHCRLPILPLASNIEEQAWPE